jgi:hypothetical protein
VSGALQAITGSSLSTTVTSKLQLAVFPAASVTTNVFVVVPNGNSEPLANPTVWLRVSPGQLSLLMTLYVTAAPQIPESLLTAMSDGQVIVGASVSLTVTVKLQLAVLPETSVAWQLTVVVPT